MSSRARADGTRQRLLEAAAEVFAAGGYRRATIAEICRRAGANIAAINYHFGDKQGLYAAVFDYAQRRATREEAAVPAARAATPEDRLRVRVTSFLTRLLDPRRPAWIARLMAHELIEPTAVLDRLVRDRMRANHDQIADAVRELLGSRASPETVRLCTLSVISQCVFYRHSAAVVTRLYPGLVPSREVERIADHVTEFSLAAIRGLARNGKAADA
jgi:TetR/AcrR family transcriptional regulator, regulator of cefoperazone and chloramphenicol sensitivity